MFARRPRLGRSRADPDGIRAVTSFFRQARIQNGMPGGGDQVGDGVLRSASRTWLIRVLDVPLV